MAYDTRSGRFAILIDPWLLKDRRILDAIKSRLHLPPDTGAMWDEHYQCGGCKPRVTA